MSRSQLVLILSFNCGSIVAQTKPNKWLPLEPRATQEVSGETCSGLWFVSKNGQCRCGASIHDVVQCNEDTKSVMILDCYCMTPKSSTQAVWLFTLHTVHVIGVSTGIVATGVVTLSTEGAIAMQVVTDGRGLVVHIVSILM